MDKESMFVSREYEDIYRLWADSHLPDSTDMPQILNAKFHLVNKYEPEKNGFHWLKGIFFARYEERMIAAFGHNVTKEENNTTELAHCRISDDNGETWGSLNIIDNPEGDLTVSHGVFLNHKNKLWAFLGAFYGEGRPGGRVHTRAYTAVPGTVISGIPEWENMGVVAWDGFWPMQEPILMDNGQYIVAGTSVGSGEIGCKNTIPAVALIDSNDLTQWKVVRIPTPKSEFSSIWGECTIIINKEKVLLISRSNRNLQKALVATSENFGRTWSPLKMSDLPMADSKPYAGMLSDGRIYLINTIGAEIGSESWNNDVNVGKISARNPLSILVGDKDTMMFNKAYRVIDSLSPLDDAHGYSVWAYPYAIEWNANLIIGFYMDGYAADESGAAGYVTIPICSLN